MYSRSSAWCGLQCPSSWPDVSWKRFQTFDTRLEKLGGLPDFLVRDFGMKNTAEN